MTHPLTQIATCCYCGVRSVLQLTGRDGHELACASCGAPLHNLKALKQDVKHRAPGEVKHKRKSTRRPQDDRAPVYRKKKLKKPRKSGWKRAMEEIFDVIEDIID